MAESDELLIRGIREGRAEAWGQLIARFEGRMLAFVRSRLPDHASAEDVVQETFVGFLTSLPNYDGRRSLESYLFAIAAHKLTDHLRRNGRRPALPLSTGDDDGSAWEPAGGCRAASSIARSGERRGIEESALASALKEQIEHCRRTNQRERLACMELLLVRGCTNKAVAEQLKISEQAVANHKFEFLARLRTSVRRQDLPRDVFPELYAE
jgi:RNA polymerase sigma-70 factor (ECF subfamily)